MPHHATVVCIGHAVQDFVFSVPDLPRTATKHRATAFSSVGGGPAATAAVAVARLGGHAVLAARVGDDAVGAMIVDELAGYGVDCALVKRVDGCRSSVSSVMVDAAGERLIVNYLDPRMPGSPDWLPPSLPEETAVVLADSRWPDGAWVMLERARSAGIAAVLDADSPMPRDSPLVAAATHVAFSEPGLHDYCGAGDPHSLITNLSRRLDGWCCVTQGERGVIIADRGQAGRVAAFDVAAVDTLGAGDVWHGAFALALAERRGEIEAVTFANAAAALKVGRRGGRAGVPTRAEVDTFLAQGRVAS
jgi:sulfofructose kinase